MSQQKQNPKIDWGYYATTPRIVRTHYKKLTHVEKWLYVCLKDLCGDTGTCYRTLRVLSEETDLSTGTLSTGIRHLQEAGLVHAEKKRRSNNPTAKEVWHITIVDIWQENGKVHPTAKCSGDEQKRSPDEHSDKNVQGMNNNVQEMNKDASKRSPDEQKRSNFDDRSNNTEAIPITEERTPEEQERESPPNTLDTHTIVSSDTAHAEYPLITFADCLSYLQEQGVAPQGEDAVQVMVQARTLYAHKHPRYEYRARPGLSEHPDDQWPSKQNEEVFRNDAPQGDAPHDGHANNTLVDLVDDHNAARLSGLPDRGAQTAQVTPQGDAHATAASGHPHRVGDVATADVDNHHGIEQSRRLFAPETGPILEAQEITEGDTHATRVPTVPRADHPASLEHDASGHPQSAGHCAVSAADVPVVVYPVGRGTPGTEDRAGRTQDGSVAEKDATQTLTETPPTSMPAQSLPLPQAEQAALGARAKGKKPAQPKPETRSNPPVEPPADMAWGTRKCLLWFDFWRGGILIGKWKLMQASTCAKGLAEQFDEQTVIQARTDMEADPYYVAKGGCDVCDVANNIHKYLKRRQNKKSPNVDSATSEPLLSVEEEFGRYWGINEKRGMSYATA